MKMRQTRHAALALIFICLSSSALGQVVTVKRIDARPPGHPLDTGSPFDPIMDDALRQTIGTSAGSATGACVIRVPEWIPDSEKTHPSAKYYMYFSDHHGSKIKMAWSASITGQWTLFNDGAAPDRAWGEKGNCSGAQTPGVGVLDRMHHGGSIRLDDNTVIKDKFHFVDVYADDVNERIIMYFHSLGPGNGVATSKYGLNFNMPTAGGEKGHGIRNVRVTEWYLRSFELEGEAKGRKVKARFGWGRGGFWRAPLLTSAGEVATHANANEPGGWWTPSWPGDPTPEGPAQKWSTKYWWTKIHEADPLNRALPAPELHNPERSFGFRKPNRPSKMPRGRHYAIHHDPVGDRDKIYVFRTVPRSLPESVGVIILDLAGLSEAERLDPNNWKRVHDVEEVILKPRAYWEGVHFAYQPSNGGVGNGYQLRDPYVFKDRDGKLYLFYSGFGEANVGVAELSIAPVPRGKSIRVTAPHRGHPIVVGNVYPIGWVSRGPVKKVDIEYSVNRTDWVSIVRGVNNSRRYKWTVPRTVSKSAVVRVRETGGAVAAQSEPFTITTEKALAIISPRQGTVYVAGRKYCPVYWSTGSMKLITFEYSVDGGEWITITENHSDISQKKAQWNAPAFGWTVPQIESESVRLRVSETGGRASAISEPFSIVAEKQDGDNVLRKRFDR